MWANKYLGMDYVDGVFDCMDLAVLVGAEQLGINVRKPAYDPNCWSQRASLINNIHTVCAPADAPQDKQPVLFLGRRRFFHIGVFVTGGWILHNDQKLRNVILTRIDDMPNHGYELEGYYHWIT